MLQLDHEYQITGLQNLNDRIYKLAEILKRKQENKELLTIQDLLLEDVADEMRGLLLSKPINNKKLFNPNLEVLLSQITPENKHQEIDFGIEGRELI